MIYASAYIGTYLLLYFAYVGTAFYGAGVRMILADTILLSAVFGVSSYLYKRYQEKGYLLSLLLAILSGGYIILLGNGAELIIFLPAYLGMLVLVWQKRYAMDYYSLVTAFGIHSKAALPMIVLGSVIFNIKSVLYVFLPFGVMAVTLQIFLMRILRHDPSQRSDSHVVKAGIFPVITGLGMASLFAVWGQNQPVDAYKSFYEAVILPLFTPFIYLMTGIGVYIIDPVVRFVFSLMGTFKEREIGEEIVMETEVVEEELEVVTQSHPMFSVVLTVLLLILVLLVIVRWMQKPATAAQKRSNYETERRKISTTKETASPQARKIREIYRNYLKYLKKGKVKLNVSDTTADILEKGKNSADEKAMREIYIKTRYNNQADTSDVHQMQDLYTKISNE